jgi:HesB-like selenoprotein
MLRITPKAVDQLKQNLKEAKDGSIVRLRMAGYGWGGPAFGLTLDESINDNDTVVEEQEIKVAYDSSLANYLKGTLIDYRTNIFGQGQFQVITGYGCWWIRSRRIAGNKL